MSLTFITVPVFFDTTVDEVLLVNQWRRMYHYGHQIMPVLAIGTFALYAVTCIKYHAAKRPYGIFALAAAATVIMIPFTWFIMASTNNRLFQLEAASKMLSPTVEVAESRSCWRRGTGCTLRDRCYHYWEPSWAHWEYFDSWAIMSINIGLLVLITYSEGP